MEDSFRILDRYMNDMNEKERGYINLKEVVFAGRTFCKLRQFLEISKQIREN